MTSYKKLAPAVLTFLLAAVSARAALPEYAFGFVPEQKKAQMIEKIQPVLDEVGLRAGVKLVLDSNIADIPTFYAKYNNGDYDFAFVNPNVYAKTKPGLYKALARQEGKLQGIVVVPKYATAKNLKDLSGQAVAFPSKESYAATVLVERDFAAAGVDPKKDLLTSYLGSHDKVYEAVIEGHANAGGGVMRTFLQLSAEDAAKLRILYTTGPAVAHPIVANSRVPEATAAKVAQAFLSLNTSPEGRQLLKSLGMGTIVAAKESDYDLVRGQLPAAREATAQP